MKHHPTTFKSLFLILVLFAFISCTDKENDPTPSSDPAARKYDIKSGTIHFNTDLAGFKGTKIVYFDDYGAKEHVETYEDGVLESTVFSDGKKRYNLEATMKIAYLVDEYGERGWEMEFHTWEEIQQFPGYQDDYKKVENITVVGKDCEAYRYNDLATFAGWKGLTLYHQQNGGILIEAIKLEEDVTHDASKFKVPDGFEIIPL